jgi:hypothetical protein
MGSEEAVVRKTHFIVAAAFRRRIEDLDLDEDDRERTAASARRLADRYKRRHPAFSYEWFFGACGLDSWGEVPPPFPNPRRRVASDPNAEDSRSD